jgi:hypothetical protein
LTSARPGRRRSSATSEDFDVDAGARSAAMLNLFPSNYIVFQITRLARFAILRLLPRSCRFLRVTGFQLFYDISANLDPKRAVTVCFIRLRNYRHNFIYVVPRFQMATSG